MSLPSGRELVEANYVRLEAEIATLRAENERLKNRDQVLSALEAAGVDNWDGYEEALSGESE